jgi:NADPH2 dehydrogenase
VPSPIKFSNAGADAPIPQEITADEIQDFVGLFATAAKRAVAAGFDGVEVHGANGFLVDQFPQDMSNKRTDVYGGSIEKRVRFPLEVIDAIAKAIGAEKTAIRLSPWCSYQSGRGFCQVLARCSREYALDMRMEDPVPQFSYFIAQLAELHPSLAYIHLVEPGVDKLTTGFAPEDNVLETDTNDPFRKIWAPRPFISCGNYVRDSAIDVAERKGDIVAFGRYFITNVSCRSRVLLPK